MTPRLLTDASPLGFHPRLVIFDKDGTLIDFHAMWSGWVESLAAQLEAASGVRLAHRLYECVGYDCASRRALPGRPLAVWSMARIREWCLALMLGASNLSLEEGEAAMEKAWAPPDPVALARPVADLPTLLTGLRAMGMKIAVATTDDREPTLVTLSALGLTALVDAIVAGDDGVPIKPAPEMVWAACQSAGVPVEQAIVVGDSIADMVMGRAAGAGLTVGVLTGVSSAEMLAAHAGVVLNSIADLI